MINAATAAQNVRNYEIERYNKIKELCNAALNEMDASIEYHSRNGFDSLDFTPYQRSRFTNDYAMQTAHDIFEKVFKENGYTIEHNDISLNSLKIKW